MPRASHIQRGNARGNRRPPPKRRARATHACRTSSRIKRNQAWESPELMPMRRPAAAMEPVSRMPSSRSALPGPMATSGLITTRRRTPGFWLPAFTTGVAAGATPRRRFRNQAWRRCARTSCFSSRTSASSMPAGQGTRESVPPPVQALAGRVRACPPGQYPAPARRGTSDTCAGPGPFHAADLRLRRGRRAFMWIPAFAGMTASIFRGGDDPVPVTSFPRPAGIHRLSSHHVEPPASSSGRSVKRSPRKAGPESRAASMSLSRPDGSGTATRPCPIWHLGPFADNFPDWRWKP